jgi:hypothetical protein
MVCTVTDDGTETIGDIEWDDDSWCLCPHCDKEGRLKDFYCETKGQDNGETA